MMTPPWNFEWRDHTRRDAMRQAKARIENMAYERHVYRHFANLCGRLDALKQTFVRDWTPGETVHRPGERERSDTYSDRPDSFCICIKGVDPL